MQKEIIIVTNSLEPGQTASKPGPLYLTMTPKSAQFLKLYVSIFGKVHQQFYRYQYEN
jgi:hypothetical protein